MTTRLALYFIALAVPLLVSVLVGGTEDDPLLAVTALRFGLVGLAIMSLQFVLASRAPWTERMVGLDRIFRFHRTMAIIAVVLLAAHPVLIATAFNHWDLLLSIEQHPAIILGKLALLLMLAIGLTSVYRLSLKIEFERWRKAHNVFAVLALSAGGCHAWFVGQAHEFPAFRIVPVVLLVVAAYAYIYAKLVAPSRASRSPYVVLKVTPVSAKVTTLELAPTGHRIDANKPGQFAFIRFRAGSAVPAEEHPFTISSAPSESGRLTFTIKDSGDFTANIREARPGDLVAVQGPYGVFSNAVHPGEKDLVFIAGGIGITPLMSMIRGMKAASFDAHVLLIYGNRTEGEIVFREELDELSGSDRPNLRVVHVLDKPGDDWQGARGFISRELIARECGPDLSGKAFYVCGPVTMMDKIRRDLRRLGVPTRKIRWERFSL